MENAEEIQLVLERYSRLKPKEIPEALEEYMSFVAKTGDTVFKWPLIQHLFREKLMNVITEFHDSSPSITDLPHYPNVDPFNFDLMKKNLIERMESFCSAPFTIQRICELLTEPRKQYSRIDKFMRAIEKNILVVSTTEPGRTRHESENGESLDSTVNGDVMSEGNLDVGSSEEEQNLTENPLPTVKEDTNGTEKSTENPETIDPLAADNPEIDMKLEKAESEVNVETNEPLLKVDKEETKDEKDSEVKTENVPETSVKTEDTEILSEKCSTETATKSEVKEENKSEEDVTTKEASPSKRVIEHEGETVIPTDESVSKKAKVDSEPTAEPEVASEQIPTNETNSNSETETVLESQSLVEPITEAVSGVELLAPEASLLLDAIVATDATTNITPTEQETPLQPLPPIETIQAPETNMEPEPVVVEPVVVGVAPLATAEDEDLMKVDAAPLVNAETKMQTDEIEETAASAMDIDECSADFIME